MHIKNTVKMKSNKLFVEKQNRSIVTIIKIINMTKDDPTILLDGSFELLSKFF